MTGSIPSSHPRYHSLVLRERLADAMRKGIVHETGLIAHGRGEAFDYLLGECTIPQAQEAIEVAAYVLLHAHHPVISVNGNVAALVPDECVLLSKILSAPLEVNLFHRTKERMHRILKVLEQHGAQDVLGWLGDARIPGLDHDRARCDAQGIYAADVLLVPLEDGDRCQALVDMGKTVIAIDLNPLSRTARTASITIVDNVIRALPLLISSLQKIQKLDTENDTILEQWNNTKMLEDVLSYMAKKLNGPL
jgi:4-phosphopantoate--beta-alanine ligase